MVTEVKTSDCWLCGHALLCPDGRLRCGLTLSDTEYTFILAQGLCDVFGSGGFKLYKPEPPIRLKIIRRAVKPIVKPKVVRTKKVSTSQQRML